MDSITSSDFIITYIFNRYTHFHVYMCVEAYVSGLVCIINAHTYMYVYIIYEYACVREDQTNILDVILSHGYWGLNSSS